MDLSSEVIGAMITPSVLISAVALLQLSTANRLAKLNDRILHVTAQADAIDWQDNTEDFNERDKMILEHLPALMERLVLLRSAIIGIYVTIGLLVTTSIALGMHAAIPTISALVPTGAALFAAVALLYSITLLVREAWLAVQFTVKETNYARQLWQEKIIDRARRHNRGVTESFDWGQGSAEAIAAQGNVRQPPKPL